MRTLLVKWWTLKFTLLSWHVFWNWNSFWLSLGMLILQWSQLSTSLDSELSVILSWMFMGSLSEESRFAILYNTDLELWDWLAPSYTGLKNQQLLKRACKVNLCNGSPMLLSHYLGLIESPIGRQRSQANDSSRDKDAGAYLAGGIACSSGDTLSRATLTLCVMLKPAVLGFRYPNIAGTWWKDAFTLIKTTLGVRRHSESATFGDHSLARSVPSVMHRLSSSLRHNRKARTRFLNLLLCTLPRKPSSLFW